MASCFLRPSTGRSPMPGAAARTAACAFTPTTFKPPSSLIWTTFKRTASNTWSNFLRGVSKFLEADGHRLTGADIAFGGDVPREAGLSSSAAVEVGATAFWNKLLGLGLDPVYVVKLSRRTENEFVGVPCGIMDQFISALGRRDHALFLDCRDLTYRHVPLRADVKIVVCNSGVKRALAQSEYEVRLKQCREAVAKIAATGRAVKSLRDVQLSDLDAAQGTMDNLLWRRAHHVVSENQRMLEAVTVLESGDLERFGELMNQSHESLRDDYEVSSKELDTARGVGAPAARCFGGAHDGSGLRRLHRQPGARRRRGKFCASGGRGL